jgi:hypothetical protein
VVLALLAAAAPARAQDQEAMKQNLAKKLEGEFLKKAPWVTEYPKALSAAKKGNKLIFAFFTRSYAR